jgi:hypothetical protein
MNRALPFAVLCCSVALADPAPPPKSAAAKKGEYLVTLGGCHDCHTPKKMGPRGPELDTTRLLSGHPQEMVMPPPPPVSMPWGVTMAATLTAFSGPWGVSYAANLTPDKETGLGAWTEQNFLDALSTGRHMGRGRPILPPMPWENLKRVKTEDLKAIFAYLKSIPAVKNQVPDPVPPMAAPAAPPAPAPSK